MRDRTRRSSASFLRELGLLAIVAVGVVWALQHWVVGAYRIPSTSMEPTLEVGQRILVNRLAMQFREPSIGEIVVFHPPANTSSCADPAQGAGAAAGRGQACDAVGRRESTQTFVKRVVGLPGDRLAIIGGEVIRNGRRERGADVVACPGAAECEFPRAIVVPRGTVYLMGDDRPASADSRFWGPVPRRWLIGQVFFSVWPISRLGTV